MPGMDTIKPVYGYRKTVSNPIDWIHDCRVPDNCVPCKIIFKMQGLIYLGHPWINFDSVLYSCILQDVLGDDFFNLPTKSPISLENIEPPFMTTLGVNHTSISFFNDEIRVLDEHDFTLDMIYKRFEGKDTDYLIPQKQGGKIRKGSGKFKNFWLRLPYITPETVTFYTNGNIEEIERLLKEYSHTLGLKRSINALNVKKVKIKEIEKDKSLIHEKKAMRPLPCKKYGAGYKNMNLTYKPPYWNQREAEMCIFPCSELLTM